MIQASAFDPIHDCQAVFRAWMAALANPGQICDISASAARLDLAPHDFPALTVLAMTVCDRETTHAVPDNADYARRLAVRTLSRPVPQEAGFLFVTAQTDTPAIDLMFTQATPGTLPEPHRATTLLILVDELLQDGAGWLSGPGIAGRRRSPLNDDAVAWVLGRDRQQYEYPTGVDLVFVTPDGQIAAVPRRVRLEV